MNFKKLAEEVNDQARKSGWWDTHDHETLLISAKLFLIVSELVEALEEVRKYGGEAFRSKALYYVDGKPEGGGIEVIDALIRMLDLIEEYSIDAEKLAEIKHEFNKTRTKGHGGKKL